MRDCKKACYLKIVSFSDEDLRGSNGYGPIPAIILEFVDFRGCMRGYPDACAGESKEERRVKKKPGKHCSIGKRMV